MVQVLAVVAQQMAQVLAVMAQVELAPMLAVMA